ncbi:TetR/AcrR family transcriptional regulator [Rhizobium binae]|uniref:TetR/AcrR family transcriptional regulator n=1 Tax=Rhizobium binae TaxID=1138190 RepID=UPI003DA8971D
MPRLSRAEGMALTREKLKLSARKLYLKYGYAAVSIERIAAECSLTRGAFYAHFRSKEAIYLEILETDVEDVLAGLITVINRADTRDEVIDAICDWADGRFIRSDMSHLMIEVVHHSMKAKSDEDLMMKVRQFWGHVGKALERFFPNRALPSRPEEIGSIILLLLAEGPFVEVAGGAKTSRLVRLTLEAFLR